MDLNADSLTNSFIKAAQQVFFDLLAQPIEMDQCVYVFAEDDQEKAAPVTYGISSELKGVRINFTGDFHGELILFFSKDLARAIGIAFLTLNEVDTDEVDECIDDILGEIANMMAGLIKNSLIGNKYKSMLGLPHHFDNKWVTFEDTSVIGFRNICTFPVFEDIFMADLLLYATE